MASVHGILGIIVIVDALLFTAAAAFAGATSGASTWLENLRWQLVAVIVVQLVVGVITFAGGARPGEELHLVYGVVSIAPVPLASSFAAEAPPKPRAWVLATGGVVTALIMWRSWVTGG